MRNLVVVILALGLSASVAHADHVDWSQYLEPPGAKPMPVKAGDTPAIAKQSKTATKAKPARATPVAKKAVAKKPAAARKTRH